MPKRKASVSTATPPHKRPALADDIKSHFRADLFDPQTLDSYKSSYGSSKPYKHGVIQSLIQTSLLRAVRSEIAQHVSFTPKETDIYKIHQSGDLANLDGLDPSALKLLPSLVTLRDAMYSREFRDYLSDITGAGELSGKRTDMAVNVYTPGCHLLCHDDVIGSRRVSYILYLVDPDEPWQANWGGALRLYPTVQQRNENGQMIAVPEPDHSVSIPPAFSQLSFFAVQPGFSYHDVEEVYARKGGEAGVSDSGRIRMAISGWYHIPQPGEEGYKKGAEERQAERSSLAQLQGRADEFEEPKQCWINPARRTQHGLTSIGSSAEAVSDQEDVELSEADLEFLIEYMNPRYLTPETVSLLRQSFTEDSSLRLAMFLAQKCELTLRDQISEQDLQREDESSEQWQLARPPYKHRYLYQQTSERSPVHADADASTQTLTTVLQALFPSLSFRKWLALVTGLTLGECDVLARRFRRGKDYSLATSFNDETPQLEVCLGLTPTDGWTADDKQESQQTSEAATSQSQDDANVGGYEAYLAGDEDDDRGSVDAAVNPSSATGAGQRRGATADPAVYESKDEDEDDGMLFTQPASWNALTIVLRDKGTLKFVKYVSKGAPGDRWDVSGAWRVTGSLDDEDPISDDEQEESSDDSKDDESSI